MRLWVGLYLASLGSGAGLGAVAYVLWGPGGVSESLPAYGYV